MGKKLPSHSFKHTKRSRYNLLSLKDGRDVIELDRGILDADGAFYTLEDEYPDTRLHVKALDGQNIVYFPSSFIRRCGVVIYHPF